MPGYDVSSTIDPMEMAERFWPDVYFYKEQQDIIYSVVNNDETYVPAGNKLGKDFVAGFLVLWFFLTRHPCRIVTTSAKDDHLRVLWGEVGRFIQTSKFPLLAKKGGPIIAKHHELGKLVKGADGTMAQCPMSYVRGLVAAPDKIAAMQGHHVTPESGKFVDDGIPRTMFLSDESSSVPDAYYTMASTWFNRAIVIGNTWPCENFFKRAVKAGDKKNPLMGNYFRKVIKIKAEDSPNVRLALAQKKAGKRITNEVLVPGVKTYNEYLKNLELWDKIQICVSLHADFYEGAENLLFPPEWLNRAEQIGRALRGQKRVARAIGVDPAEGGDKTALAVVDEYGLIELLSEKTPDTSVIPGMVLAFAQKHSVPAEKIFFDRGGGGKQHYDWLRKRGHRVQSVPFGESLVADPKRGMVMFAEKVENREDRYVYKNRRAQMYGSLSIMMDPTNEDSYGFGIPEGPVYADLRKQFAPIPKWYDEEGRLFLPPKHRKAGDVSETAKLKTTMTQLVGHSPDEADAVVLAVYGMSHKSTQNKAGAIVFSES